MSEMFKIKLPDGSVREMPEGSTPADVAAAIGPGLAKAALAARIDGEVRDLNRPFEGDANLALITSRDEKDALELVRHDFAHVLAEAVQKLYPGTQITFGPATDDGFYYDFAPAPERGPFTDEDLPAIEEEMRRIIAADEPLVREVWSRGQVRDFFQQSGEAFKAEWVMELPEGEPITMYRSGSGESAWIDLCRGPHLASTGKLDPQAFKFRTGIGSFSIARSHAFPIVTSVPPSATNCFRLLRPSSPMPPRYSGRIAGASKPSRMSRGFWSATMIASNFWRSLPARTSALWIEVRLNSYCSSTHRVQPSSMLPPVHG